MLTQDSIRDLLITTKICSSILFGVFTAFLEYRLFSTLAASLTLAPLAGGFLAGGFFLPSHYRSKCMIAVAVLLFGSILVGALVQIDRAVYYRVFATIGGFVCIIVFLALLGWLAANKPDSVLVGAHSEICTENVATPTLVAKVTRKSWSYNVRKRVWIEYGRKCYICKTDLKDFSGAHMELDHIRPISLGGEDTEDNLAACCPRCNRQKHDHDHPELYT